MWSPSSRSPGRAGAAPARARPARTYLAPRAPRDLSCTRTRARRRGASPSLDRRSDTPRGATPGGSRGATWGGRSARGRRARRTEGRVHGPGRRSAPAAEWVAGHPPEDAGHSAARCPADVATGALGVRPARGGSRRTAPRVTAAVHRSRWRRTKVAVGAPTVRVGRDTAADDVDGWARSFLLGHDDGGSAAGRLRKVARA